MIFGTDTSAFQPPGTYNPGQFELINAYDPTLGTKVKRNEIDGRPWGVYLFIAENHDGTGTINLIRFTYGDPPAGYWWDYEGSGINEAELSQLFAEADALNAKSGYYASDGALNHAAFLRRPFWLAQYPGANDGSYPGQDHMEASRPVNIWQYSSSGGKLDVDIIVDEAWWNDWIGVEDMAQVPQDQWQALYDYVMSQRDGAPIYGVEPLLPAVAKIHSATGDAPVPQYGVDPIASNLTVFKKDTEEKLQKIMDKLGIT